MGKIEYKNKFNVLKSRNFSCEKCGYNIHPEILEIHHKISSFDGGTNNVNNLLVLCPNCHNIEHYGDHSITKENIEEKLYIRFSQNKYKHLTVDERVETYEEKKMKREKKRNNLIIQLLERLLSEHKLSKKRMKELITKYDIFTIISAKRE